MSSLGRYLAPARDARPNPGHVVEWRHGEAGPWHPFDPSATRGVSLRQTEDLLASPPVLLVQGDLVRVLDPKGQVVRFLVMTEEGLVALPATNAQSLVRAMRGPTMKAWFRACGHDWERAWEGSERADWMLSLAGWGGVDSGTMTLAACACAATALRYVPAGEERPRMAIETARRWARGEATALELGVARQAAWTISWDAMMDGAGASVEAVSAVVYACGGGVTWNAPADAAMAAARAASWTATGDAALAAALASMATLVRQHLPLRQLALALVARPTRLS